MKKTAFRRYSIVDLPQNYFDAWLKISQKVEAFHNPFFSPYFARAAADAAPGSCFVTVKTEDDIPVGFFPFQFTNATLGRAGRIGLHLSDYNGLIAAQPLLPGELARMLAVSGVHQYSFDHLHKYQAQLGLDTEFIREGTATHLTNGFDAYWEERERAAPSFTKLLLRRMRKISREQGELRFEFHSPDPADLSHVIETKRRQYVATGADDSLATTWTRQCLANLLAVQTQDFRGVLSKLYAGDQLISSHFGIMSNGILHYWFPIYEPAFSSYSPGLMILYFLAKHARHFDIHCIDNGMGTQRHKSDFANQTYQLGVGSFRRNTPQCLILRAQDYLQYRIQRHHKSRQAEAAS